MASAPIILVPGFWLGAWAWDEVAAILEADGHEVTALTLPGLESKDADRSAITFQDHVDAIIRALEAAGQPAVLAVHSATGFTGYAASDQVPERIAAMVYVDTAPGKPPLDPDFTDAEKPIDWDRDSRRGEPRRPERGAEGDVPRAGRAGPGGILRGGLRRSRTTPGGTSPRRSSRPATPPRTTRSTPGEHPDWAFLAGIPELRNVTWIDLPTSHWPMWSKPTELAQDHRRRRDEGRARRSGGPMTARCSTTPWPTTSGPPSA